MFFPVLITILNAHRQRVALLSLLLPLMAIYLWQMPHVLLKNPKKDPIELIIESSSVIKKSVEVTTILPEPKLLPPVENKAVDSPKKQSTPVPIIRPQVDVIAPTPVVPVAPPLIPISPTPVEVKKAAPSNSSPVPHITPPPPLPISSVAPPTPSPAPTPLPTSAPTPAPTPAPSPVVNKESEYVSIIKAQLNSNKRYPTGREASLQRPAGKVQLWFELGRDGSLKKSGIEESSQSLLLDSAALSTIRRTTFPAWPENTWPNESIHRFTVSLEFIPIH